MRTDSPGALHLYHRWKKLYILFTLMGKGKCEDRKTRFTKFTKESGFTFIELLIVVSIIGIMLSVSMPISFNMYTSYKASLKAQEVMVFISGLRRDAFLYSERKLLSSKGDVIMVNDEEKVFEDTRIRIDSPIVFYRNGTTSGGTINIYIGDQAYSLSVNAPLGDLLLARTGSA